ncbi:MAG: hypothetical protein ABIH42_03955 [Planctomycetota bacterium]
MMECNKALLLSSKHIDKRIQQEELNLLKEHLEACRSCNLKFKIMCQTEQLIANILKDLRIEEVLSNKVGEILAEVHTEHARKSPEKKGVIAIIALGVIVLLLLFFSFTKEKPESPSIGSVERIVDKTQISHFDTSKWLPFSTEDKVILGSSIKTIKGECSLLLDNNIRVIISNSSICDFFYFKELKKIVLVEGKIYIQSPDSQVQVDVAESKVLGDKCEFCVKLEPKGTIEVYTIKGDVALFNNHGSIGVKSGKSGKTTVVASPELIEKCSVEKETSWALPFLK